jgi:hypothetical protein
VINNSKTSNLANLYDSITDEFCDATKEASFETNDLKQREAWRDSAKTWTLHMFLLFHCGMII